MLCSTCKEDKPATQEFFHKAETKISGLVGYCKACKKVKDRERYLQTRGQPKGTRPKYTLEQRQEKKAYWRKKQHYKKAYGLSVEQAEAMLAKGCEVCSKTDRLHIDHCHTTGQVRGVLCYRCNTALGLMRDSGTLIGRLRRYATDRCFLLKVLGSNG